MKSTGNVLFLLQSLALQVRQEGMSEETVYHVRSCFLLKQSCRQNKECITIFCVHFSVFEQTASLAPTLHPFLNYNLSKKITFFSSYFLKSSSQENEGKKQNNVYQVVSSYSLTCNSTWQYTRTQEHFHRHAGVQQRAGERRGNATTFSNTLPWTDFLCPEEIDQW